MISYNPKLVPSVRINDVKEPICRQCIEFANPIRAEKGLPPIEAHPDAYRPVPEEELDYLSFSPSAEGWEGFISRCD